MSVRNDRSATLGRLVLLMAAAIGLVSCGGGSNPAPPPPPPTVNNTASVEVNAGPAGNSTNMLFVSVTVCMPGSTTNCQTIDHVQVDTGSEGLRVLSTALGTLDPSAGSGLPTLHDSNNNQVQECVQFADTTYAWGPVASADISIAGETASSVPIQVISLNPPFPVPSTGANNCLTLGNGGPLNTQASLAANGIIGLGNFPDDCGGACAPLSPNLPPQYYVCPSGACSIFALAENNQVTQPVVLFASDNNGVLVSMPTISDSGQATASGSLIFGIGTQSNNALGSAKVYAVDNTGSMTSTYKNASYPGFLDTGSTGIYFLDSATLGITECIDPQTGNPIGLYCPASTQTYTVTNTGANQVTGTVTFNIANADALFSNTLFAAFNNLGGDSGTGASTDLVDLGMPFFYGRNVFVGIMGQSAPSNATNTYGYFAF